MIKKFSRVLMGVSLISALAGCGAGGSSSTTTINSLVVNQTGNCKNMPPNSVCGGISITYASNTGAQIAFSGLSNPFSLTTNPSPCAAPTASTQTCALSINYAGPTGGLTQTLTISLTGTSLTQTIQVSGL